MSFVLEGSFNREKKHLACKYSVEFLLKNLFKAFNSKVVGKKEIIETLKIFIYSGKARTF